MRRVQYKKYLLLGGALFLLMSVPTLFVERCRYRMIALCAPIWKGGVRQKSEEHKKLEAENHLLRLEIGQLKRQLQQRSAITSLVKDLQRDISSKRGREITYLIEQQLEAIPAKVIYRDPNSWSSSLWVNVGEKTHPWIAKNSPVLIGNACVGVVDYVGKRQSRIRLITDVALNPSVRAVRGFFQNVQLDENINVVLAHLQGRGDIPLEEEEQLELIAILEKLKHRIMMNAESWYLAKGILEGGGAPLWRSRNHVLKGIGFNYDFGDAEGPARALISGKVMEKNSSLPPLPIIQANDLLVTTGMDGIFPPGLRVAEVSKVHPLREGAYAYEIEAIPVVKNLDTIHTVFIIPPVGFDREDQP
ncbi:MAG: rod shape-determining protein MreC [Chlamydiales bacterium]